MPNLRKITADEFNVHIVAETKKCPAVQVLDGVKTQISDTFNVLVRRGMYKHIVFIPDALLGEVRWNRAFKGKAYNQIAVDTGVVFMFNPL
jgi:hypothetical protein